MGMNWINENRMLVHTRDWNVCWLHRADNFFYAEHYQMYGGRQKEGGNK